MAVTTTEYGNYRTHKGTLAEVMAAINGVNPKNIVAFIQYQDNADSFLVVVSR